MTKCQIQVFLYCRLKVNYSIMNNNRDNNVQRILTLLCTFSVYIPSIFICMDPSYCYKFMHMLIQKSLFCLCVKDIRSYSYRNNNTISKAVIFNSQSHCQSITETKTCRDKRPCTPVIISCRPMGQIRPSNPPIRPTTGLEKYFYFIVNFSVRPLSCLAL